MRERHPFRTACVSKRRQGSVICLVFAFMPVSTAFVVAADQPAGHTVRRLRGVIDQDQTFSGHIIITDHLSIIGATVTVAPGTLIEFAHAAPGSHPVLTVGSELHNRGKLLLQATAKKPIIFRSRPGTHAGRIEVYVRNRLVQPAESQTSSKQPIAAHTAPEELTWQHLRFENLGYKRTAHGLHGKRGRFEAAITFHLIGQAHTLRIAHCAFNSTSQMEIEANDDSTIRVIDNRFDNPQGRVAVEISGSNLNKRNGSITVSDNRASAALVLDSIPAVVKDNILIGPNAAIVVTGDASPKTRIIGNYIHNTTAQDDGHYCLNCENPRARIENNILRGGTTCVLNAAGTVTGNVLIGAAKLSSPYVKQSRTHQLIAALPRGAVVERNLLLGPAYSLLIPQPFGLQRMKRQAASNHTTIRHNVFDGFNRTDRAINLNPEGRPSAQISVSNNLFLRVSTVIRDAAKTDTTIIYADHNAYAPRPSRVFDQLKIGTLRPGQPGWAAYDVVESEVAHLALHDSPPLRLNDYDEEILAGRQTIPRLRQMLFDIYRPRDESPLVGAGRIIKTGDRSAAAPSIGATEPLPASK